MLDEIVPVFKNFRDKMYQFFPSRRDAAMELAEQQTQTLTKLLTSLCPTEQQRAFHLFVVDCTPEPRIFSPTLKDRSYAYAPITVCGNKPVTIGHKYSIAAYLPEKSMTNLPPWLIPLACTRIDTTQIIFQTMGKISASHQSKWINKAANSSPKGF